jgi:hypothetical protein
MRTTRRPYAFAILGVCMLGMVSSSFAGDDAKPEAEPDAKALLLEMASFLASTPAFSVKSRSGYDVVQDNGQKIEFSEQRKVTVGRPNRLRMSLEQSDGDKQIMVFDGAAITVASDPQNVYGRAAKVGTIDDAVAYFLQDLRMRLPLALMLTNKFPAELERRTQEVAYVEQTSIDGAPVHHLAARTPTVDFQIWIAKSKQPLPLRVVLTYKTADGQPQYWADFSDWNLAPALSASTFTFTPTATAREIPFMTQVPQLAAGSQAPPPGATSTQTSGAQQ